MKVYIRLRIGNIATGCFEISLRGFQYFSTNKPKVATLHPWSDNEIHAAVTEVGTDKHGVIIVTDMFGGTPANVSMTFLEPQSVEVLTGVNLPMLLKFFNSQENLDLDELAGILKSYGQQSIALASEYLQR